MYSTVVVVALVLLVAYFITRRRVRKTGRVGERRKEIIERMRDWNEKNDQDDDSQPGPQDKS
jgi:hypothetical protein